MNTTTIGSGMTFKSMKAAKEWTKECEQKNLELQEKKQHTDSLVDCIYKTVTADLTEEEQSNATRVCARTSEGDVEEITYKNTFIGLERTIVRTTVTDPVSKKLKSVEVVERRAGWSGPTEEIYSMNVVDGSFMGHMGGLCSSIARSLLRPVVSFLTLGICKPSNVPDQTATHPQIKYGYTINCEEEVLVPAKYFIYRDYKTVYTNSMAEVFVNKENGSMSFIEAKDGRVIKRAKTSMNSDDLVKEQWRETGWNLASQS